MALEREGVARWIADYEAAWRRGRSADLGGLFTADAVYCTSPGAEPLAGIGQIRHWWRAESDPAERWELTAEVLAVDGDRAVARLDVRYSAPAQHRFLDLWLMRFAPDGRCAQFEEWYWSPEP
jgi:ketosteroid isomerase-like protein